MRRRPETHALLDQGALPASPALVIEALSPLLVDERRTRIEAVLAGRTRDVAVVLDAVHDPRNVSAVLRSADAFGVQEVHLVPGEEPFVASKLISQGADRWLDVIEHPGPEEAIANLRGRGFTVYAATMDGGVSPAELARVAKVAVVFGNEKDGVRSELSRACDGRYTIPMRGFSQSLNVSVAAAITLQAATAGRVSTLTEADREALRARFMLLSVPRGAEVVAEHLVRRRA